MKKFEKIILILIVIALIMKFSLIPGGSVLVGISLTILSIIYYLLGFAFFNGIRLRHVFKKQSYKGISALRVIGGIGTGMGLSTIIIGIQFKLLHVAGADMMLKVGLGTTIVILFIAFIKFLKAKDEFYKLIFSRIAIIGGLGLILAVLPALTLTKIQFRNHPEYIEAYKEFLNDPQNEELRKKKDEEFLKTTMTDEEIEMYMKNKYSN